MKYGDSRQEIYQKQQQYRQAVQEHTPENFVQRLVEGLVDGLRTPCIAQSIEDRVSLSFLNTLTTHDFILGLLKAIMDKLIKHEAGIETAMTNSQVTVSNDVQNRTNEINSDITNGRQTILRAAITTDNVCDIFGNILEDLSEIMSSALTTMEIGLRIETITASRKVDESCDMLLRETKSGFQSTTSAVDKVKDDISEFCLAQIAEQDRITDELLQSHCRAMCRQIDNIADPIQPVLALQEHITGEFGRASCRIADKFGVFRAELLQDIVDAIVTGESAWAPDAYHTI